MSTPEPTPLAQGLLDAAFKAALDQKDKDWAPYEGVQGASYDLRSFFESEHRAAVVAVLRELARTPAALKPDNGSAFVTADEINRQLRALADSIEKGAE